MFSTRAESLKWLAQEFSSRLAGVLELMAGERPAIEWEPSGAPEDATLRWRQPYSGIEGAAWIAASDAAWSAIAGAVLRAAGLEAGGEESDAASLKSTFLELVGQALAGLEQALTERLHREIARSGGGEAAAAAGSAEWVNVHFQIGAENANLAAGFETALMDALGLPAPKPQSTSANLPAGILAPQNSKTFPLLLEVELPVNVSFGRAQAALKDVLKLTTGSIVELNRAVSDPVEVIVNNCVIARGEVVVVEGNFGVRIQHVISREERLRTLN